MKEKYFNHSRQKTSARFTNYFIMNEAGIELTENTISIGDGGNEKELFELTKGILIGNNQTLLPLAWKQVNTLTEAVDLLP